MKILFDGIFGSHLYGLSRPESDRDYKSVYLPTMQQLVLNVYKDTIETQSPEKDSTLYALNAFVKNLGKCDTVSMDMIHTPKEFTLASSNVWESMQEHRSDLYCKNMRGILGYIRTMSSKYGHKVQRYEEIKELHDFARIIRRDAPGHIKVSDTDLPEIVMKSKFKYITFNPHHESIIANIDVCGSRHQISVSLDNFINSLDSALTKFGKRVQKSAETGGDWKSLSHSVRVLIQLEEIIDTRDLIFPLVRADEIMPIKLGQVPQDDVISIISDSYDRITEKLEASDLPEYNDMANIINVLMEQYGE